MNVSNTAKDFRGWRSSMLSSHLNQREKNPGLYKENILIWEMAGQC